MRYTILGGGIAGMQAAITAHKYGHKVTLIEKGSELGGNLLCERNVPFKDRLHDYIEQQKTLIEKAGIEVHLNTDATPEYAKSLHPDAVFVAIGSVPAVPPIKGIDMPHVKQAMEVFKNPDLAAGKTVILGGGLVGTELAIHLVGDHGKKVDVIEMLDDINAGDNQVHKRAIEDMIIQKNIPIHLKTRVIEITENGVRCECDGKEVFYEADTVVNAAGMKSRMKEALAFNECAPIFYMIGDCRKASNIIYATGTAYTAAKYLGRFSEHV